MKIRDALETIQPDDELIARTELMLKSRTKINKPHQISKPDFSKLSLAACLVLIIGTMSVSAYAYYQQPVNYLDIDINPSLELGINRFERVVDVNYYNDDAENLIDEKTLRGRRPEEAVALVIDEASNKGYISQDKASVVSLAAIGNDAEKTNTILKNCSDTVKNNYSQVAVFSSAISNDLKKEADTKTISAGKLNLIKMVQSLDETATVEEYKDNSVTEIIEELNYLTSESNKDATESSKSNVTNGIQDVTDQVKKIEEKINTNGKKSIETENDNNSDSDNKSENHSKSQNSSSKHNSASDFDEDDAPLIPESGVDTHKNDSKNLPVNGHQQTDDQSGIDNPKQNADHSQFSGKQPIGGQAESDFQK